jgi:hypothetical protein
MKNVYLLSNVPNGGKTYLEYLIPAIEALRNDFNCIVLQTNRVGLRRHEAEKILNFPVNEVDAEFIASLESQVVISNDAWAGRLLDDSNFGIFISHGNVGMPTKDKYYYAELTAYWDAIVSPSRSGFDLIRTGLQLYRRDRKALKASIADGIALRSDLRKTSPIATRPIKTLEFVDSFPSFKKTTNDYVVGLLPTQLGICAKGATLYENLQTVINTVKSQIPHARFILRPYMTDLEHPTVSSLRNQLSAYEWVTIDEPGTSSKVFYQQCDTMITDASTGGVSFMLNSGKLPIYYAPPTEENNPIVDVWLKEMDSLLPIAKNSEELKDLALGFSLLTAEDSHLIYKKFYQSQFSNLPCPQEILRDLVEYRHASRFCELTINSFGHVMESDQH